MADDDELVDALSGPQWGSALAALWDRHQGLFVATARSSTRSDADCEDLLSETFTRLAERAAAGNLRIETSFRAFVVRSIKNAAMNRARGQRRVDVADEPIGADVADHTATPIDLVVDDVDQQYIATAFEQLSDTQRDVLLMVEVEGMKPREVADLLGMTANNVSQIAVRARSALREGWVKAHLAGRATALATPECAGVIDALPAYVVGSLRADRAEMIDTHLATCGPCAHLAAELRDDTTKLRGIFLPLLPLAGSASITSKLGIDLGVGGAGAFEMVGAVAKKGLWQTRRLIALGSTAAVAVSAVILVSVLDTSGETPATSAEIETLLKVDSELGPGGSSVGWVYDVRIDVKPHFAPPEELDMLWRAREANRRPFASSTSIFASTELTVECSDVACQVFGDLGFIDQISIPHDAEQGYFLPGVEIQIPMTVYRGCVGHSHPDKQGDKVFLQYQSGCPTLWEGYFVTQIDYCQYPPEAVSPTVAGFPLANLGEMPVRTKIALYQRDFVDGQYFFAGLGYVPLCGKHDEFGNQVHPGDSDAFYLSIWAEVTRSDS
jgi:RNA polymerase sigma factor (sigma-70 family)